MPRGPVASGELLLVVLRLLEQRPMDARELLGELDRALGWQGAPSRGDALLALAALEAETLVEVVSPDGRECYRITAAGSEAVAARAATTVTPRPQRLRIPALAPRRARSAAVQHVAVLFTDVSRSTEMLDELGDEAAHRVMRRHFKLLRDVIEKYGGREVKSLGDGLMVVFDGPPTAAAAALAMQQAVGECEDDLRLRVGIAAGETVCEDDDYFGRPVVVARRLCDAADDGEVLVAGSPRGLVPDSAVEGAARPPITLKGLSEPVSPTVLRAPMLAVAG